jgi:putative ABC transport system permease protein
VAFTIALPYLNKIMETELLPKIWQIFILNFAILTVLVAGAIIYPSFVFIRISVTNSLKSQIFAENKLAGRNIIATIQYSLSLVLLIASIVVTKQLNLMLNHDLGFISKNIISTELFHTPLLSGTDEEMQLKREAYLKNYQYVKEELTTHNSIEVFAQGASPVKISQMPWKLKGNEKDYSNANNLSATSEYMSLLGLEIVEGRFFENDRDEPGKSVVINEAAKKYFGIKNISDSRLLNKYWSIPQMGAGDGYKIVGVVKDFSYEHLSKKTQPLIILNSYYPHTNFLIRFEDGATQSGIQLVQKLFNEVNPGEPFEYTFLADDIEAMYQKEKRLSEIYILFTIIAYSISSLGLFAISLYDTRRRTKEIGIRKVNGAKISEILAMLNKDFAKWVIIAFIIAAPVAYFAMHQWLENFAYKTSLSWWIFALAGLLALGIALLTVSWQSWKAAIRNPVEALRYE